MHPVTDPGIFAGTGGMVGVGGRIGLGEGGVTGTGDGTGGVSATGGVAGWGRTLEIEHPAKNEIAIKTIAMDFIFFIFIFSRLLNDQDLVIMIAWRPWSISGALHS